MATRAQVKASIRRYLGTDVDDPLYGDQTAGVSAQLDPLVQEVVDSLVGEIHEANPGYLSRIQVLAADTPVTGHLYSFQTQSPAITDFAKWLEVRFDNEDGAVLYEARLEELRVAGSGYFTIRYVDEIAVLETSKDTTPANPIFLRFAIWPVDLASDSSVIGGIPKRYIDVVALEALFVFGVGGESRWPDELRERWKNRRAALFAHIQRRGVQPARTRLHEGAGAYL